MCVCVCACVCVCVFVCVCVCLCVVCGAGNVRFGVFSRARARDAVQSCVGHLPVGFITGAAVVRGSSAHNTAQHSTAQHSTAQLSSAQHSAAQLSTAQSAQHTAQHSTARPSFFLSAPCWFHRWCFAGFACGGVRLARVWEPFGRSDPLLDAEESELPRKNNSNEVEVGRGVRVIVRVMA